MATVLLKAPRPGDIGLLVKAGLDLDQCQHLLAGLRRLDQCVDDGGVAGRAIKGLLDRQDMRIISRLLNEALNTRRERVVRMVQQNIAMLYSGEHVGGFRRLHLGQVGMGRREEGWVLEFGSIEVGEGKKARQGESPRQK